MISERAPLQLALLYPGQLLQEMTASFQPTAAGKGLEFKVEPYPDWHDVVIDEVKVGQIVGTLLGNAIKYTASGWVRLAVTPPDGEHWSITVEDTGTGMASEDAAHVFDRFHHLPNTSRLPGTDLGLPICKQLVDQLEGRIVLRSVLGQGTHLKVRLPVMLRCS